MGTKDSETPRNGTKGKNRLKFLMFSKEVCFVCVDGCLISNEQEQKGASERWPMISLGGRFVGSDLRAMR